MGEEDKSAINFHKLFLLNLLILCEPKQNKWEVWWKWGLEVEEVAENPPEDDDDGGDDGTVHAVTILLEAAKHRCVRPIQPLPKYWNVRSER